MEFPEEFLNAEHPRGSSESSFFLTASRTSLLLDKTVNNYAMDSSELELVDYQSLDANHSSGTVFHFVLLLDKPPKTAHNLTALQESTDSFSDRKHECNVGSICVYISRSSVCALLR